MKKFIPIIAFIFLCACTHRYHDGTYKASLGVSEVVTVNGNEVTDKQYGIMGDLTGEYKYPCTQYTDRIEVIENGKTVVLRSTPEHSLRLNDMIEFMPVSANSLQNKKEEN